MWHLCFSQWLNFFFFKSCILETLNLSTNAESRINTILEKLQDFFLWRGCVTFLDFFFFLLFRLSLPFPLPQLEEAPVPTSSPSTSSPPNKHWIFDCSQMGEGGLMVLALFSSSSCSKPMCVHYESPQTYFLFSFIPIYHSLQSY